MTLDLKKLKSSLQKAKNLGFAEERFEIDGLELVVRSINAKDFAEVLVDLEDVPAVSYQFEYQAKLVSRAIVEIAGEDLRDITMLPSDDGSKNIERHAYLYREIVSKWPREILFTVFKKFLDATTSTEKKAVDGVTFLVPNESDESKFRRLLNEAKEVEDMVPPELRKTILQEMGFAAHETAAEIQEAVDIVNNINPTVVTPEPEEATIVEPAPVAVEQVKPKTKIRDPHATFEEAVAARTAMSPVVAASPIEEPKAPSSDKLREMKAMESLGLGVDPNLPQGQVFETSKAVEVVQHKPIDPKELGRALDSRPAGGINPKFNPQRR